MSIKKITENYIMCRISLTGLVLSYSPAQHWHIVMQYSLLCMFQGKKTVWYGFACHQAPLSRSRRVFDSYLRLR